MSGRIEDGLDFGGGAAIYPASSHQAKLFSHARTHTRLLQSYDIIVGYTVAMHCTIVMAQQASWPAAGCREPATPMDDLEEDLHEST